MKLSARNQFVGEITNIKTGAVNAIVSLKTKDFDITGTISNDAVNELGLVVGKHAYAIIKATEVMIGKGQLAISARNQIQGNIKSIKSGAVNDIVTITAGSTEITATITKASVENLELTEGAPATAVIKATSVMFGIE